MGNDNVNKGLAFEKKCLEKLQELGFNALLTKHTDYGADIVASDGNIKYVFQCKYVKSKQGVSSVQEVLTAKHFYNANICGVISESGFTIQAYQLAKPNFIYLLTSNEFFNLQDKNKLVSVSIDKLSQVSFNYDIIKAYENLKEQIKQTPTWAQLDKTLRYQIKKEYGNYSVFLKKIGHSKASSKPTNDQLKLEYKRIRSIVGKTLTANDIKKHTAFPYNSFHSYPLTKLQKECGDRPNIERGITNEQLISEYLILAKKLGRNPTSIDLDNQGLYKYSYYVPHRWKNLRDFLKDANIPESEVTKRRYSDTETVLMYCLIEQLIRLKENNFEKEINSTVLKNLKYNDKILFSRGAIANKFASLDQLLKNKKYKGLRQKLQQLKTDIEKDSSR